MTINTVEKLQEKLDKNLAWRKRERQVLENQIRNVHGQELATAMRAGIVLLYAHWEGFIKTASRDYLEFLNRQRLSCTCLQSSIFLLTLKKDFLNMRATHKSLVYARLLRKIENRENIFYIDTKDNDILSTQSNLSFEVLEEILFSLGISRSDFELRQKFIDHELVGVRNQIAHGEFTHVIRENTQKEQEDQKYFLQFSADVFTLLETFKEQLLNAVIHRKYLKEATQGEHGVSV